MTTIHAGTKRLLFYVCNPSDHVISSYFTRRSDANNNKKDIMYFPFSYFYFPLLKFMINLLIKLGIAAGAPNEYIVQNHLNKAFLKVF